MLKRVKTIFSIICTVSMLLSASAVPSYADDSTTTANKPKDAFDTIGAADFDVWPTRGRCYAK